MVAISLVSLILALPACKLVRPEASAPTDTEASAEPAGAPAPPDATEDTMRPYPRGIEIPEGWSLRAPAVAGSWYPGSEDALRKLVEGMLDAAPAGDCDALPLALVAPHAGYRFSGPTAARSIAQVRGCTVRRVWVLGVSHHLPLRGIGLYAVDAFTTPMGVLPLDRDVIDRLAERPGFRVLPDRGPGAGDGGEHSIEMELPLLQGALGAFELVPLLVGSLDPDSARRAAEAIRPELGPGDLLVVSGDFTHYGPNYGYVPFREDLPDNLARLDLGALAHVLKPDPAGLYAEIRRTGATICGRNTLLLATSLVGNEAHGTRLAYTTSGALTGDWTNSVSYVAARIDGPPWSGEGPGVGRARLVPPATAEALRRLAEKVLSHWFATGEVLKVDPAALPEGADRTLGAFVTLTRDGALRGCIGEIEPRRAAWKAVVDHALDAALRDPRFPPVTADEFEHLDVEVSLLGPSTRVRGPEDIILGRHGIVLSLGARRATFLPQVAPEQGWNRAQTVAALAHKAGIPTSALDRASWQVYEAQVAPPPHREKR